MERGELDLAHYDADTYKNRMTYEMLIIDKMGYCDYYLIVRDFVLYAKGQEIPTGPGRGSGAGSLVAYLVGITEIDPIRYGLLFERFLNLRGSVCRILILISAITAGMRWFAMWRRSTEKTA